MTESLMVEYVSHMGDDLSVVNAARVSFDKVKEVLDPNDENLLNYLAKHKHWTPFAHPVITFRITAPIFVARQLFKHKVGLVENEVSRRYVDYVPKVFKPTWRGRADNKKQGSAGELVEYEMINADSIYKQSIEAALFAYDRLLEQGVCPEQARAVLPQSMLTSWIWTGSLASFWRVCEQRMHPDAQKESSDIAEQIFGFLNEIFPKSLEALSNARN
jgi:thymidylate synthase (FAD)